MALWLDGEGVSVGKFRDYSRSGRRGALFASIQGNFVAFLMA
jgi:hypothetical protein